MSSRKLNFDEDTKQFIALYMNIKGEVIEKRFTANKPYQDIINFWRDVDKLSIRERMTQKAEYMEDTQKRIQ